MKRYEVPTPSLLLDIEALEANIAAMADHAAKGAVKLRPHAKSHKSVEIARLLAKAGALGPACATIGEAQAMAEGGVGGIMVTAPLVTREAMERVRQLLTAKADISLVLDDAAPLPAYAEMARASGRTLPVLVELDVGQDRTGYRNIADAAGFAREAASLEGLAFAGVQAYWGHLQQAGTLAERRALLAPQVARLKELLDMLEQQGLPAAIVTGGGTGTSTLDAETGLFTEIQPGSFLFLDSCYASVEIVEGESPFRPSLFVAAAVVSTPRAGHAIINAGFKAFATDSGRPLPLRGVPEGTTYTFKGDEHGALSYPAQGPQSNAPALGSVVELLTSHCDPTVNLHARYFVVRGDEIVDTWPIMARGY